ncbi:putative beta-galactosidase [Xylogone sp. PMI_703]|nr:putative beta-galactosidase [Xylogone sp. PMI_703]
MGYIYSLLILFTHLSSFLPFALCIPRYTAEPRQNANLLQDIVTWDQYSLFVHGERVIFLSGEFHPFRLPSPGLWLDVFQKIRALGYSGASFYVDWALLEGEQGHIRVDGVFALDQFFSAASQAGIYLIARPGPYINSEVSGGGFPGWLARLKGRLKTTDQDYLDSITPYISTIGGIIAKAQITNGGPVILFQPENEYTICVDTNGYTQINNLTITGIESSCLEKQYMAYVEEEYRKAGIIVPFIVNDAFPVGNFAPGTGIGAVDIYSFDDYPLGWSTAPSNASDWGALIDPLLLYNFTTHEEMSPSGPFSISEFQGGCPDAWGGVGVETSAAHINHEFERIFYKLNYGFRIAIQSLYMIFGGTNWGNLGYSGGYTSYDVGAAISENRQVSREKYSELKLQANFLQVSPSYLTTHPENISFGIYTETDDIGVTHLAGSPTSYYIIRHKDLTSLDSTQYKFKVNASLGHLTIPQLGGHLTLNGRDSKFHVVDYDIGSLNLIYSTAEVFTWKKSGSKTVLVLYGGEHEVHEFAVPASLKSPSEIEGGKVVLHQSKFSIIVQWTVSRTRRVVKFGNHLEIHLLWRNDAYNYWVLDLPAPPPLGLHVSPSREDQSVIVKAGYLLRSAEIIGKTLHLSGDLNKTTEIEVISAPNDISSLYFNGKRVNSKIENGRLVGLLAFSIPHIVIPDLKTAAWRYIGSLPEIKAGYDDKSWTLCDHEESNNLRNLSTPTSLYATDYGYNTGSLLYRGHFVANGSESALYLLAEAGYAFGYSVWLDSTYLGSWKGSAADMFYNQTLAFPTKLQRGRSHVVTILIDHMGIDENFPANVQIMKDPRGILDYDLKGRDKSDVSWKISGNLGGEKYQDLSRGPLNEGAMYAERQGYHLPGAPQSHWEMKSPISNGISKPGVGFFATSFDLHMPAGYDIPLSLVFSNNTRKGTPAAYRVQFYINGWQFGKYINHIGPQLRYPIPEGILNYNGNNYLALTLWSQENQSVRLEGLTLEIDAVIQSGYQKPSLVEGTRYAKRKNSY